MSVKLTPAQVGILLDMEKGAQLRQEFDVWAGYWWELDGEKVDSRPANALLQKGEISLGEAARRFSGRRTRLATLPRAMQNEERSNG